MAQDHPLEIASHRVELTIAAISEYSIRATLAPTDSPNLPPGRTRPDAVLVKLRSLDSVRTIATGRLTTRTLLTRPRA
jgi:hypothetical protein